MGFVFEDQRWSLHLGGITLRSPLSPTHWLGSGSGRWYETIKADVKYAVEWWKGYLMEGESIYLQLSMVWCWEGAVFPSRLWDRQRVAGLRVGDVEGAENEGLWAEKGWAPAAVAWGLGALCVVNAVRTKKRDRINVTWTLCFLHILDHLKHYKTNKK